MGPYGQFPRWRCNRHLSLPSALMLYFCRWALDHPWVLAANFHDGAVVATFPFDYYPPGEISFLSFFCEDKTLFGKINNGCSGQTRGESLTEDDKTVRYCIYNKRAQLAHLDRYGYHIRILGNALKRSVCVSHYLYLFLCGSATNSAILCRNL
jgi:hypothetical protein